MKLSSLLVGLLLLLIHSEVGAGCRTITLPDTTGSGGAWRYPNGVSYPVVYTPPPGTTSVGLEFWMHQFPYASPPGDIMLLWYLNDPQHPGRRMGIAWSGNADELTSTGVVGAFKNFALSTFVHPQDQFVVAIVNNSGHDGQGYLAVTIRECF